MKILRHPGIVGVAAFLVVLLAGLGVGNFLHQVVAHGDADHGPGSAQSCAVCAASQHALADLAPEPALAAPRALDRAEPPAPITDFAPQTERAPSAPRAPPTAA
jgi:hypothetical protein